MQSFALGLVFPPFISMARAFLKLGLNKKQRTEEQQELHVFHIHELVAQNVQ